MQNLELLASKTTAVIVRGGAPAVVVRGGSPAVVVRCDATAVVRCDAPAVEQLQEHHLWSYISPLTNC